LVVDARSRVVVADGPSFPPVAPQTVASVALIATATLVVYPLPGRRERERMGG
jgi:hypothetical protein